jgi:hypothetical protein
MSLLCIHGIHLLHIHVIGVLEGRDPAGIRWDEPGSSRGAVVLTQSSRGATHRRSAG